MTQLQTEADLRRRPAWLSDTREAMVALLGRSRPQTDSEAFALLRRGFPAAPLGERVAAVSRWRAG